MNKVYDVIVVGAGASGIAAALSAAREGASVLLLDRAHYPGGTNTQAMVCPLMTFHSGSTQVVRGIAEEVVERLKTLNGTLGHLPDPLGVVSTITPIDTDILKLLYFAMLEEEKTLDVELNRYLIRSYTKDGVITSIECIGKSDRREYLGRTFIDATGDGDLAYLSGASFLLGREKDGLAQPMTLMFKMRGVNRDEIVDYIEKAPEQFIFNRECDLRSYLGISGFFRQVERAKERGDFNLPRDRVLCFEGIHKGDVIVNMTRATHRSGIKSEDLSAAEFTLHQQIREVLKFLKNYIPGFENATLDKIADSVGVRESRRIIGVKTIDSSAIIDNKSFEDSVAMCAFPIDIHDPAGADLNWVRKEKNCSYDIPFSVMLPKDFKNLLVTGRCISATHEALASLRVTPTAMALGEAAGLSAAMTTDFTTLDIKALQKRLYDRGAIPGKKWL